MLQLSSKNGDSSLCYDVIIIKILKIDKFGDFSSEIDFKTKMDIFRDDISLIINQCHLQATEGSLPRTQSVRQPHSGSKRSALVDFKTKMDIFRDYISLIINQCDLQATEGSLRRTQSVRQPRSASKKRACC